MQSLPAGAMLVVSLSEEQIEPLLGEDLALAAVNGPSLCVVSGTSRLHRDTAESTQGAGY